MVVDVALVLGGIMGLAALAFWLASVFAAQLAPLVPLSVDQKLGEAAFAQYEAEACPNPAALAYVERVVAPLLAQAKPQPFEFHFRVVDDPAVNAFALPGGYVLVNYGLLESAENGSEVAGVLAHELQHVLQRHGTKRQLRQLGAAGLLGMIFGGGTVGALSGTAANLTSLAYDRAEESEADVRGAELLIAAHIDPAAMERFFARLAKEPTLPALVSNHPDPGDRARVLGAMHVTGQVLALPSPSGVACH